MSDVQDLAGLPPEAFFHLAVERGGLDLEAVIGELSPEAASALRQIAAPVVPATRGVSRSLVDVEPIGAARGMDVTVKSVDQRVCPSCGQLQQGDDRFCRHCGYQLNRSAAAVTLDDLVTQGRLSAEQADEALSAILLQQSHYPAGARYSVFGGPG
jgi:hypothetical protein